MHHDAIVIGLGAMGSAAAFHLAGRGLRVLGIDRWGPPHAMGSSHGHTRIIRKAYFEHPQYVPLVERAYELWAELERDAGETLLVPTGGLMIGREDGVVVRGALASAREHGLDHELMSPVNARERFPAFRLREHEVALFEPDAGYLRPERCIAAHLAAARARGATLHTGETVTGWEPRADGVRVTTDRGHYDAACAVFAAGAWAGALLASHHPLPLRIERQVQHWFAPTGSTRGLVPPRFPVFIWEHAPESTWYGFPLREEGMKLAVHHGGESAHVDTVRRTVSDDEVGVVEALARALIPDAAGPRIESSVCLYSNTPDEAFIVDTVPGLPQAIVASPCSGHGFKFSSAIGETIADLVTGGRSRFDLAPFRLSRFTSA